MALPSISYTTQPQPALTVILAEPYLDVTSVDSLRQAIEAQWQPALQSLLIDCAAVEFMDSSGVGLLVALHKRLGGGARRVQLRRVRPSIRSVFALLCLEDLFDFV